MKLAFFLTSFLPRWVGGTEVATHDLARALAISGHEIHIVASLDKCLFNESIIDGYHFHRIARPNVRILWVLFSG